MIKFNYFYCQLQFRGSHDAEEMSASEVNDFLGENCALPFSSQRRAVYNKYKVDGSYTNQDDAITHMSGGKIRNKILYPSVSIMN